MLRHLVAVDHPPEPERDLVGTPQRPPLAGDRVGDLLKLDLGRQEKRLPFAGTFGGEEFEMRHQRREAKIEQRWAASPAS